MKERFEIWLLAFDKDGDILPVDCQLFEDEEFVAFREALDKTYEANAFSKALLKELKEAKAVYCDVMVEKHDYDTEDHDLVDTVCARTLYVKDMKKGAR